MHPAMHVFWLTAHVGRVLGAFCHVCVLARGAHVDHVLGALCHMCVLACGTCVGHVLGALCHARMCTGL